MVPGAARGAVLRLRPGGPACKTEQVGRRMANSRSLNGWVGVCGVEDYGSDRGILRAKPNNWVTDVWVSDGGFDGWVSGWGWVQH